MKKMNVFLAPLAVLIGPALVQCADYSAGNDAGTSGSSAASSGAMTSGATGSTTGNAGSGSTGSTTGNAGSGSTGSTTGNAGSGSTGAMSGSGTTGSGSTTFTGGPCDILKEGGNPCVAAHSTARALSTSYTGNLYQVTNPTAGTTLDIGVTSAGIADSAAQDTFCGTAACTITIIYDQSGNGNDLKPTPSGGGAKATADLPALAAALPLMVGGQKVYGILVKQRSGNGVGYRAGCTGCDTPVAKGTATGDDPETEYMVTSQNNLADGCCFDYGNAETDVHDDGASTMEAVYLGGGVIWGTGSGGPSRTAGPWAMMDMEDGLFAGWENNQNQNISTNMPLKFDFVTDIVVGYSQSAQTGGRFAIYGGDATSGVLMTEWDGTRPPGGYNPMHKQGSIILGTGGDNSDTDGGEFFEGVMATGAAAKATLDALQANIVAAKYAVYTP